MPDLARRRKPPPPSSLKPLPSTTFEDASNTQIPVILRAALEVWAHQLLYQRHVYPRQVFGWSRFLGVRVHTCRHPQVVKYIREAIQLAIPSLLQGVADQVVWSSLLQDNDRVLEVYRLQFSDIPKHIDSSLVDTIYQDWEVQMRNLVLSVMSLPDGTEREKNDDSLSFRIQIHISSDGSCNELNGAFSDGTWRESPSTNNTTTSDTTTTAPLYHVNSPAGRVDFFREYQQATYDEADTTI